MENPSVDLLDTLASALFKFGPFFLAFFLPLVILAKARAWYNDANTRQTPLATEEEKKTYKLYFLGSVGCSAIVVFLSLLAWWHLNMRDVHTYQVAIVDLPPEQLVEARYFSKEDQRVEAGAVLHDKFFFIEQEIPFQTGQRFAFDYFVRPTAPPIGSANAVAPVGATASRLWVQYAGRGNETFRIHLKNGRPSLVPEDAEETRAQTLPHVRFAQGRGASSRFDGGER